MQFCTLPTFSRVNANTELDSERRILAGYSERVAINKGNRQALVDLLRESRDNVVELYGIWDGDFVEAPKVQENIAAETILDSGFLFKEGGFYRVAVERVNEARKSR